MISTNVAISHADNSVTCSHEKVGARAVVIPPSLGIVHVSFQFENDSLRKTAEVHYEAMQDVLTPELQVEDPTIAEQGP